MSHQADNSCSMPESRLSRGARCRLRPDDFSAWVCDRGAHCMVTGRSRTRRWASRPPPWRSRTATRPMSHRAAGRKSRSESGDRDTFL